MDASTYVNWMLVALVATIFVIMVREGPIHDAAWEEPCRTLRSGGSIEGAWYTVDHCKRYDPRRAS